MSTKVAFDFIETESQYQEFQNCIEALKGQRGAQMPALQEAVDYHGPVVTECIIDDDDKVFPMVAPGSSIAEVFDEADINK